MQIGAFTNLTSTHPTMSTFPRESSLSIQKPKLENQVSENDTARKRRESVQSGKNICFSTLGRDGVLSFAREVNPNALIKGAGPDTAGSSTARVHAAQGERGTDMLPEQPLALPGRLAHELDILFSSLSTQRPVVVLHLLALLCCSGAH